MSDFRSRPILHLVSAIWNGIWMTTRIKHQFPIFYIFWSCSYILSCITYIWDENNKLFFFILGHHLEIQVHSSISCVQQGIYEWASNCISNLTFFLWIHAFAYLNSNDQWKLNKLMFIHKTLYRASIFLNCIWIKFINSYML